MSVIVVTGASRGIGRAIVARFHAEGHQVVACARRPEVLAALAADFPGVDTHVCDMADRAAVTAFAQTVRQRHGGVDLLVNNAGGFQPGGVASQPDGMLEDMLQVNLFSAYWASRAFLPDMQGRASGTIINICSIASMAAYANGGAYSIAKHAMLGFSRNLREEMKPHGIRVSAVMPGATLSDSWDGVGLPDARLMPAEDVAAMVWMIWAMSPRTVVEDVVMRPMLGDIAAEEFP